LRPLAILPRGDRVLISRDRPEEQTEGGIVIPPSSQEIKSSGWIVALGPDCPDDLAIGQRVLLTKYSGTELTLFDHDYVVCFASDLACLLEDEPTRSKP
jgi:chaperonin GroES